MPLASLMIIEFMLLATNLNTQLIVMSRDPKTNYLMQVRAPGEPDYIMRRSPYHAWVADRGYVGCGGQGFYSLINSVVHNTSCRMVRENEYKIVSFLDGYD